jgi:hypothetical protein
VIFQPEAGHNWYFNKPVPLLGHYTPDSVVSAGGDGQDRVMKVLLGLIKHFVRDKDKVK